MSELKKAILGTVMLFVVFGAYWGYQGFTKNSFGSGRDEQAVLVQNHIKCAAFYALVGGGSEKIKENPTDGNKKLQHDFEHHAKMSFYWSSDKKQLDEKMNQAMGELKKEMDMALDQKIIKEFMLQKDLECNQATAKSLKFIGNKS